MVLTDNRIELCTVYRRPPNLMVYHRFPCENGHFGVGMS